MRRRLLLSLAVSLAGCAGADAGGSGGGDALVDAGGAVDSVGGDAALDVGGDAGGDSASDVGGDAALDVAADAGGDAALDVGGDASGPHLDGPFPYPRLSDYDLFVGALSQEQPSPGVLPYEVAAPLWSDNASKHRFLVLPPGEVATPHIDDIWELPVGSVLVKTFGFREDLGDPQSAEALVETRLLIHEQTADGPRWKAYVYLWSADQTDADAQEAGSIVQVSYTDAQGAAKTTPYVVPNTNQCIDCHGLNKTARPIGITTRQLSRDVDRGGQAVDQIDWLVTQGALSAAPAGPRNALTDPYGDGDLQARARSWLDANCSHCHRAGGEGGPSGLSLLATQQNPTSFGVCKTPVAAGPGTGGHIYDIVPGAPDESILVFRIESTSPAVKMPEIPNLLVDSAGVALIREWISAMPGPACGPDSP